MNDVLVMSPLPPFLYDPLRASYACHDWHASKERAALVDAVGPRIKAVVVSGGGTLPPEVLAQLPALEIVACFGVGYDGVPVPECKARGVKVTNTPDVLTEDVADIALALILMCARELALANRYVHANEWPKRPLALATSVTGKRCGILGLGRIGKAIARRVEACGMRVAYHGRAPQDVPYAYQASLADLARDSDFLVVACPGGAATRNIVNAEVLAALGAKGTLVNIARGSIVDEPALVAALQQGTIKAAGIDAYANEPHVPAELLALSNVVLLPHVGSATRETRKAMGDLVLANLEAWFARKPLPTLIPELR